MELTSKKLTKYLGITKEMWKSIYYNDDVITQKNRELLQLIYFKGGSATATELTAPYGLNKTHFNSLVGAMGKRIAKYFNIINLTKRDNGSIQWWHVMFYGEHYKNLFIWELRPELKEAMKELGIESETIPEELNPNEGKMLLEGATKTIIINAYERNREARDKCIKYYGYKCYVCEDDLTKKYGKMAKDFIHVHHELPLSQIGHSYVVDAIKDLKPVCPNCHAIIHRRNPQYTIKEIKNNLSL